MAVPASGNAKASGLPGWDNNWYWTGDANGANNARDVNLNNGNVNGNNVDNDNDRFVCSRP